MTTQRLTGLVSQETGSQLTFVSISAFLNFRIFIFCPFDHAERQYSESENKTGKRLHCFMPLYSFTVASLSDSDDGLAVKLFQILEHIYRFQNQNVCTNSPALQHYYKQHQGLMSVRGECIFFIGFEKLNLPTKCERS